VWLARRGLRQRAEGETATAEVQSLPTPRAAAARVMISSWARTAMTGCCQVVATGLLKN
jgi:hypothetical protein